MEKTIHTPLNWVIDGTLIVGGIRNPEEYTGENNEGTVVCDYMSNRDDAPATDEEKRANAIFICRAVNSHEKLVEALEEATKELEQIRINNWLGHGREDEVKGYISKYRELLKQVKQ